MRKLNKVLAWILAFLFLLAPASAAFAADPAARVISIFSMEGESITLSRGGARGRAPRVGQRLSDGNTLSTGRHSSVRLQMDRASILLMDEQSRLSAVTSGNRLTLSLQSGEALVNAGQQAQGQTLETRIGNIGLGVRGTMFTMGRGAAEIVTVVMLSGIGDVNGVPLHAGEKMIVWDPGIEEQYAVTVLETGHNYEIIRALIMGEQNLTTLRSIYDNSAYLTEMGTVTPEQVAELPYYIQQRAEERNAHADEQYRLAREIEEAARGGEDTVLYPGAPVNGGAGPGDNGAGPGDNGTSPGDNGAEPGAPYTPGVSARPDGAGTQGSPFLISTAAHLSWVADNPEYWAGGYFSLTADIGSPTAPWPRIIGQANSPERPFEGNFDGNGFSIRLGISAPGQANVGLFARLGGSGTVQNLTVYGSVTGLNNVGGIAGGIDPGGHIQSSRSFAAVSGGTAVGGLAGLNSEGGMVQMSYASGPVTGGTNTGGLIGNNRGQVLNSRTLGPVSGASAVGGIAGSNSGVIAGSFAIGPVSGEMLIGGLAGGLIGSGGEIRNSVALNASITATGAPDTALRISGEGTLTNNHAHIGIPVNGIQGTPGAGANSSDGADVGTDGLAGIWATWDTPGTWVMPGSPYLLPRLTWSAAQATLPQALRDFDPTGSGGNNGDITPPAVISISPSGTNVPIGTDQLTITFNEPMDTGVSGTVILSGGASVIGAGVWSNFDQTVTFALTGLAYGTEYTVVIFGFADLAGNEMVLNDSHGFTAVSLIPYGDGTSGNPFLILNATHLNWMADNPQYWPGRHFRLDADIGTPPAVPWDRIIGSDTEPFIGIFNGNGRSIQLQIDTPMQDNVGMFAQIGATGFVLNLTVRGVVNGGSHVGGLAGYVASGGHIFDSASYVAVTGTGAGIGGIAGANWGDIVGSYAAQSVIGGGGQVGGIVGANHGDISSSYAIGTVQGSSSVGGIAGFNAAEGRIYFSYAAPSVSGVGTVAGIAGLNWGAVSGSIALNVAINSAAGSAHRVAGGGTLINNYAHIGIPIGGVQLGALGTAGDSPNGADVDTDGLAAIWAQWSIGGVWSFPPDPWLQLPRLTGTQGAYPGLPAPLLVFGTMGTVGTVSTVLALEDDECDEEYESENGYFRKEDDYKPEENESDESDPKAGGDGNGNDGGDKSDYGPDIGSGYSGSDSGSGDEYGSGGYCCGDGRDDAGDGSGDTNYVYGNVGGCGYDNDGYGDGSCENGGLGYGYDGGNETRNSGSGYGDAGYNYGNGEDIPGGVCGASDIDSSDDTMSGTDNLPQDGSGGGDSDVLTVQNALETVDTHAEHLSKSNSAPSTDL